MALTNDTHKPLSGFSLWAKNAREGWGQIGAMISGFPKNILTAKKADKVVLAGFAGLALTVVTATAWLAGPAAAAIQGLGFLANGAGLLNQRLQFNHHKLAVHPVIGGATAIQQVLLGGFGYAIMAGIAGMRAMTFSLIPEDRKYGKIKTNLALGFAGIGVSAISAVSFMTGRFENLMTIPSMLMGTIADRMPSSENPQKDCSRYARILRAGGNINNAMFNIFVSHSWSGVFTDSLVALNLRNAIRDYDVPAQTKDGNPLSRRESLSRYMRSMLKVEPVNGLTPQQIKLASTLATAAPEPVTATASATHHAPEYRITAPDVSKVFDAHRDAPADIPTHIAARPDNLPKNNNI